MHMPAGPELDLHVIRKVLGIRTYDSWDHAYKDNESVFRGYPFAVREHDAVIIFTGSSHYEFRPSTDIAAAWQVVEKLRERGWERLGLYTDRAHARATFRQLGGSGVVQADGTSVPHAICLAALNAMEEANPSDR